MRISVQLDNFVSQKHPYLLPGLIYKKVSVGIELRRRRGVDNYSGASSSSGRFTALTIRVMTIDNHVADRMGVHPLTLLLESFLLLDPDTDLDSLLERIRQESLSSQCRDS
jgi:hypothetical protein